MMIAMAAVALTFQVQWRLLHCVSSWVHTLGLREKVHTLTRSSLVPARLKQHALPRTHCVKLPQWLPIFTVVQLLLPCCTGRARDVFGANFWHRDEVMLQAAFGPRLRELALRSRAPGNVVIRCEQWW